MVHMANRRAATDESQTPSRASGAGVDESRLAVMRRVKRMTIEQRIELFQSLVRDAAWARGARRLK